MINFKNRYLIFAIFTGCFIAQIVNNFNVPIALGISLGFSIQVYLAIILRHYLDITIKESIGVYYRPISYVIVAIISPLFYSVLNSLAYFYFMPKFSGAIESIFITNYCREILSYLIVLPFIKYLINEQFNKKWPVFLMAIICGCLIYLLKFDFLSALLFSFIFFILIPNLIGYKGGGVVILVSIVIACYILNYRSLGPYNLSSINQSVFSYQLIFLAFAVVLLTVEGLSKSPIFHEIKKIILYVNLFTTFIFFVSHLQEMNVERQNLKSLAENLNQILEEKVNIYENNLRTLSGFTKSVNFLNETIWYEYASQLKLQTVYPEIDTFGVVIGENTKEYTESYIYPLEKAQYVNSIINSDYVIDIFEKNSRSETPTLSNRIGKVNFNDRNYMAHSLMLLPVIRDFKVVSWVYCIIDNKLLFSKLLNGVRNYEIVVYDGETIDPRNIIYQNVDNKNKIEYQSSLSLANHTFTIAWKKSNSFKSSRLNLSPLIALIISLINCLLISFLFNLRIQSRKDREVSESLKVKIKESEKRYQTIFGASSDGIVIFDRGHLIEGNIRFFNMFHLNGNIKEWQFSDLFPINQNNNLSSDELLKSKFSELQSKDLISFEAFCKKNNELFYAEIKLNRFLYNYNEYFMATIVDITERKKIEQNLIISRENALETSKAKSRFLSNMSHEIRTPLNGIIGLIHHLIEDNQHFSKDELQNLKVVEYSAGHLVEILNQILDYNKIESGKLSLELRPASLRHILENILAIHQVNAKAKNINIQLHYDHHIPEVMILDELRNGQIINNLMSNAIKFTNQGKIEVSVHLIEEVDDDLKIEFKISDTGIGIEESKLDYIFHEFTQANEDHSRKYGGTGLGLAITKKLVELQNGKIKVHSVVNKGTLITYTLKFKKYHGEKINFENKEIPEGVKFNGESILLVEDNDINIMVAKKYLEKWNLKVFIARDGFEAINSCKQHKFALIIMDFHMPNMDGITATRKIREFDTLTPIIGLSADVTSELINHYSEYQMNGFISKPFKSKELFNLIASFLKDQRPS